MLCQNSAHTSYGATSQKNANKYISDNKSAHFAVWFTQVEVCGCTFATLGWSSFRALTCAAQFELCIFSELALAYFPSITIMWCAHIFVGSLSGQFETSAEASVHPRYSLGTCTATYLHALCTGSLCFTGKHKHTNTSLKYKDKLQNYRRHSSGPMFGGEEDEVRACYCLACQP